MASELSNDETFFQGILSDACVNIQKVDSNENHLSDPEPVKKIPRKPKTAKPKNSSVADENGNVPKKIQKGNKSSKKETSDKPDTKSLRKPLQTLEKNSMKGKISPKKTAKLNGNESFPLEVDEEKKKKRNTKKVNIHENAPKEKEKKDLDEGKDKNVSKGRKSLPETQSKRLKVAVSTKSQDSRHSLNDLSSMKSINERRKKIELLSPYKNRDLEKKCSGSKSSTVNSDKLNEVIAKLETIFPNVDPDYLRKQCGKMKGSLDDTIDVILLKKKSGKLPTRQNYDKMQEIKKLEQKYEENFTVENFVKIIPDPWEYFLNLEKHNSERYAEHSLFYLKNKFKKHYTQVIQEILAKNNYSLYLTNEDLQKKNKIFKMRTTNRSKTECEAARPTKFDIDFMHEVAFIENENKIKAHIKKIQAAKHKRFKEAEDAGNLEKCQSCHDSTLLLEDAVNCPANHVFCKNCVVNYVGIEINEKSFQFKCLMKCEEKLPLEHLQIVLSSSAIASIIKRIQQEKSKPPGVDDLVCCPLCYHVTVLSPNSDVLQCSNSNCMTSSCRYCKQPNHSPMKCEEFEEIEMDKEIKDESVDLPQTCFNCHQNFVQGSDPDRMFCFCGAAICSICRKSYPECSHLSEKVAADDHNPEDNRLSLSSHGSEYDAALADELLSGEKFQFAHFLEPADGLSDFVPSNSLTF